MWQAEGLSWAEVPVNWILVSVTALVVMLSLPRLVGLLPLLSKGLLRLKPIYDLENNVRLSRDRNSIATIMVVPFALVASRYSLFGASFIYSLPSLYRTPAVLATLVGYIALRAILHKIAAPKKKDSDDYEFSFKSAYNFFILCTLLLVISCPALHYLGVNDLTIRKVAYYEILFFFVVFLIRKRQILTKSCNQLKAFLYLCTLEILPVAALAATALIF